MANHLNFHACCTRRCIKDVSLRAFALASCRKNGNASDDHLPPTSLAKTAVVELGPATQGPMRVWPVQLGSQPTLARPTVSSPPGGTSKETWVLGPWVPPLGGGGARVARSSPRFNKSVLELLGPKTLNPKPRKHQKKT